MKKLYALMVAAALVTGSAAGATAASASASGGERRSYTGTIDGAGWLAST